MDFKKFQKVVIPGDVFQITACKFDDAYNGCLAICREIGAAGIVGEINYVENTYPDPVDKPEKRETIQVTTPLRLKWEEIEYVGLAPLVPTD